MDENLLSALHNLCEAMGNDPTYIQLPKTEAEEQKLMIDAYNAKQGNLTGYECSKCKNRGDFLAYSDNEQVFVKCECMNIRDSIDRLKRAQINVNRYTFENYTTEQQWRQHIKATAKKFVSSSKHWFFIGGQNGCGKTHICTAIALELIKQGKELRYMKWKDEGTRLKALVNDADRYGELIEPYKTAAVLYVDDFFKTDKRTSPTAGDINVAFEILDARYNNELITIISSERTVDDIIDVDSAVGGRIKEMCGDNFCLNVPKDAKKDYRIR